MFLSGHDNVAVTLVAARAPPCGLLEVCVGNIAHLQEMADVHVLRGDLSPHRRVLGVGSHQMNVRVRRIPALGRQVGIPLESNLESAGLAGLDLERCPVGPVLGPVSHDQVVGPCRQPRRVAAIHVERQPILRRPPCAGMHPEQPHLVGKPAHCQCFPGRERRPARGVVEAHARGGGEAGRGVRDPQLYVTGIGRDLRGRGSSPAPPRRG